MFSITKVKMRRYYVYGLLNCHQGSVRPALISLRRTIRRGEQRNCTSDGMYIYAFSKGLITTKSTSTHYNPLVTHYRLHSMCISIVLVELKHLLFHFPQHFTALSSTYCTLHIILSSFSSHLIAVYFLAVLGGMDGWIRAETSKPAGVTQLPAVCSEQGCLKELREPIITKRPYVHARTPPHPPSHQAPHHTIFLLHSGERFVHPTVLESTIIHHHQRRTFISSSP